MTKIYSVTVFDGDTPKVAFLATLAKARLRAHMYRLQGMTATRPSYCPKATRSIADFRARGGIVTPSLRDD